MSEYSHNIRFDSSASSHGVAFTSPEMPYVRIEVPKASDVSKNVKDEWRYQRSRSGYFKYCSWERYVQPRGYYMSGYMVPPGGSA